MCQKILNKDRELLRFTTLRACTRPCSRGGRGTTRGRVHLFFGAVSLIKLHASSPQFKKCYRPEFQHKAAQNTPMLARLAVRAPLRMPAQVRAASTSNTGGLVSAPCHFSFFSFASPGGAHYPSRSSLSYPSNTPSLHYPPPTPGVQRCVQAQLLLLYFHCGGGCDCGGCVWGWHEHPVVWPEQWGECPNSRCAYTYPTSSSRHSSL